MQHKRKRSQKKSARKALPNHRVYPRRVTVPFTGGRLDKADTELGSVKFHQVDDVEFWMTGINRVFLKWRGLIIAPCLQGGSIVRYDDTNFTPSEAVESEVLRILRKQRDIRQTWDEDDNDEPLISELYPANPGAP